MANSIISDAHLDVLSFRGIPPSFPLPRYTSDPLPDPSLWAPRLPLPWSPVPWRTMALLNPWSIPEEVPCPSWVTRYPFLAYSVVAAACFCVTMREKRVTDRTWIASSLPCPLREAA
ncbi:hypothetical protein LZ31DRAFT_118539 [Colletotrichum somersetense]|nr:hypothetical protein LZ31DRAFT_118539 [Colletotrichum somersetense]